MEHDTKCWRDAAKFCKSLGGKLLQISTEEERQYTWHIMERHRLAKKFSFIGLFKDPGFKGNALTDGWQWHDTGDKMDVLKWWQTNEPNNDGGEELVGAFFPLSGLFNDEKPYKALEFICECREM